MPQNPIDTLITLNEITTDLDEVQKQVDRIRHTFPRDGQVQLQMDRRQSDIDTRRAFVRVLKIHIASSN